MKKTVMNTSPEPSSRVNIPSISVGTIGLTIIGLTPLICHRWSEKAKTQMRDKQMKKAKQPKEAKNPEEEYRASLYTLNGDGKYYFPTLAFKKCAVAACSFLDDVTKVEVRGAFHIDGEFCEIKGKPMMREDMVRLNGQTADIRYRGEFPEWACDLVVKYNTSILSPSQIANLFRTAGFSVGVGEWRPQKDGVFGRFDVK